ncbi:MAG: hypothetical protein Q3976_04725 [Corynebacterium sp.]|nr:hypothetical protein [Corynebacterium sp.]
MKFPKIVALVAASAAAISLSACSSDDDSESSTSSSASSSATESAAPADLPTAAELNEILGKVTNPDLPLEEKVNTVQDGAEAAELFEVMTQSKMESGATFEVVDPVLPDYTPDSVLTTVIYTLPEREPQTADRVQFVYEDGVWKLSRTWACTLIRNTVAPEQVPALCADDPAAVAEPEDPADAEVSPEVAPEEAPEVAE